MKFYKLSKYISVEKFEEKNEKLFLLRRNYRKERVYLITEAIFLFLINFKEFNSFESVSIKFQNLIDNSKSKKEVEEILLPFYEKVVNNGWLIEKGIVEPDIDFGTFYKKGDIVDGYFIKEIISDNKYFDIYRVEKDNQEYALKFLNKKKFLFEKKYREYAKILQKEYEILKSLNHNNICRVFVCNKNIRNVYMLMEYYKGAQLDQFISVSEEYNAKQLINELMSSLSYLHSNFYFHGDLHFGNILMCDDNGIKLIDFGMASNKLQNKKNKLIYEELKVGGVHIFMPPERLPRREDIDVTSYKEIEQFSSEVYQIGVMCYFIYFKQIPFKSNTIKTLYEEKTNYKPNQDKIISDSKLNTGLKNMLIKALSFIPSQRHKDATEMYKVFKYAYL